MAKVLVIPAKPVHVMTGNQRFTKKRVCAYCRVSTDTEEQLTSYEAQVSYYKGYIKSKPEWEYAGIYADEGITGTTTKHRVDFNRMIEDALKGKIDLIITKSISRFARNTLDCLKYVRLLKEKGVGVYFEKENIDTLDSKGEVLLTILSSLAQDESRNISENSRWGIVRRFQQGKVRVNHKRFLGYDKDENGDLIINEEEAKIVKRIYKEYLSGNGYAAIAKGLTKDGLRNGAGNTKWYASNIRQILTNEKYMGDALLQKTVTVDFLTHKRVKNTGQVQQYYVKNSHSAIVSKEVFKLVQEEMKRRAALQGYSQETRSRHTNKYPFSGKVICGNCGCRVRRKRWGGNEKYKKYKWVCVNHADNGNKACEMKAIDEEKLKLAYVKAINAFIENKDDFINKMMENIEKVFSEDSYDTSDIDKKIEEFQKQVLNLVRLSVKSGLDSSIYTEEYERIVGEIKKLTKEKSEFDNIKLKRQEGMKQIEKIEKMLKEKEGLIREFDDKLFKETVESIKAISAEEVEFIFREGVSIKERL
jgi:site-specific DNA recombinase